MSKLSAIVRLTRPPTLIPPALGVLSGAVVALKTELATPLELPHDKIIAGMIGAVITAALINSASNAFNQYYDREIDRVNKPGRPLPSGSLTPREAMAASVVFFVGAIIAAAVVGKIFAVLIGIAAAATIIYSAPPLRTKRLPIASNLTIAIARGGLIPLAGYSIFRVPSGAEPWIISAAMAAYIFGAAISKDFEDIPGDRAGGVRSFPIALGSVSAAKLMGLFCCAPVLILPLAALAGEISGDVIIISVGCAVAAAINVGLVLRFQKVLSTDSGGGTLKVWAAYYIIMIGLQATIAAAYLRK